MAQTPFRFCLVGSKYSQSPRLAASFSSGSCLFRLSRGHSVSSLLLGGRSTVALDLGPARHRCDCVVALRLEKWAGRTKREDKKRENGCETR